jgi:Mg2+ and Co2+ transporter CorA
VAGERKTLPGIPDRLRRAVPPPRPAEPEPEPLERATVEDLYQKLKDLQDTFDAAIREKEYQIESLQANVCEVKQSLAPPAAVSSAPPSSSGKRGVPRIAYVAGIILALASLVTALGSQYVAIMKQNEELRKAYNAVETKVTAIETNASQNASRLERVETHQTEVFENENAYRKRMAKEIRKKRDADELAPAPPAPPGAEK